MAGAQPIRFQNGVASLNGNAIPEKAKAFQIFYDSNGRHSGHLTPAMVGS
jgi:hypothetical protein